MPGIVLAAFVTATLLVPTEILPYLSGMDVQYGFGNIRLHPASIIIFTGSLVNIIAKWHLIKHRLKSMKILRVVSTLFLMFFVSIFTQTLFMRGFQGLAQCLENYLFPYCFFLFLFLLDKKTILKFLKFYVFAIIAISIYGLIEYMCGRNILYEHLYLGSGTHWYFEVDREGYRITTTIGHPLKNATYFLFAIPVSLYVFKKPLNFIATLILCVGAFVTGSRAAAVLTACSIVMYYAYFGSNLKEQLKRGLASLAAIIAGFSILRFSPLGSTLLSRFSLAGSSTELRVSSLSNFVGMSLQYTFTGKGMGLSMNESMRLLGEGYGFENPWLMLIVDVGLLTFLLYIFIFFCTGFSQLKAVGSDAFKKTMFTSFCIIMVMPKLL